MTGRKIVRKVSVAALTNPQRCGTIDNPHTFVKDLRRCQLCNKHIRDIHIADHIIDGSPNSARVKDYQRRKLGL
jgi:hypothetical protein